MAENEADVNNNNSTPSMGPTLEKSEQEVGIIFLFLSGIVISFCGLWGLFCGYVGWRFG